MDIQSYHLPPTKLVPNSPRPLLHYRGYFGGGGGEGGAAARAFDAVTAHGWQVYWIVRYGATQAAHYHSRAHECMVVLCGQATIRFGVADGEEAGGLELRAQAGDLFILPAGTAHKTFDAAPAGPLQLLTPHDARRPLTRDEVALAPLAGFAMMGAYPVGSTWDFATAGQDAGRFERVWSVCVPDEDPVLGRSEHGLCGRW